MRAPAHHVVDEALLLLAQAVIARAAATTSPSFDDDSILISLPIFSVFMIASIVLYVRKIDSDSDRDRR